MLISAIQHESANYTHTLGFVGGTSGKEPACQCRTHKRLEVWALGWEDPLEEGMATHPSILAWEMPQTEEPGGLESMGSHRIRHDWSDLALTRGHPSLLSLPPSPPSHPPGSSQSPRLGFLCYRAASHQLAVLYMRVYVLTRPSPLSPSLLFLLCLQVHSPHLCLHSFPADRLSNTIFLDCIFMCQYTIYIFSLSDLLHSV